MEAELSKTLDTIAPWVMWCLLAILAVGIAIVVILILGFIWSKCKRFIVRPLTEEEIQAEKIRKKEPAEPFESVSYIYADNTTIRLCRDNATDIMYIFTSRYNGGSSVTPMINIDGKPLLYNEWKEQIDKKEKIQ